MEWCNRSRRWSAILMTSCTRTVCSSNPRVPRRTTTKWSPPIVSIPVPVSVDQPRRPCTPGTPVALISRRRRCLAVFTPCLTSIQCVSTVRRRPYSSASIKPCITRTFIDIISRSARTSASESGLMNCVFAVSRWAKPAGRRTRRQPSTMPTRTTVVGRRALNMTTSGQTTHSICWITCSCRIAHQMTKHRMSFTPTGLQRRLPRQPTLLSTIIYSTRCRARLTRLRLSHNVWSTTNHHNLTTSDLQAPHGLNLNHPSTGWGSKHFLQQLLLQACAHASFCSLSGSVRWKFA